MLQLSSTDHSLNHFQNNALIVTLLDKVLQNILLGHLSTNSKTFLQLLLHTA